MRAPTYLIALAMFLATVWMASGTSATEPHIHKGTVVSAGDGRLIMKDSAGRQHTHLVTKETKITINGRAGRLDELKPTTLIRVTTEGSDKVLAIATVDDDKQRPWVE